MTSGVQSDFTVLLQLIDQGLGIDLFGDDISDSQKTTITERETARQNKDWAKSDELRDSLKDQGIGLRDTAHGAVWYRS